MNKNEMREAWIDLLKRLNGNLAVTLGGGLTTTPAILNRTAQHFLNCIQRNALGPKWYRAASHLRLTAVGFHEHPDSNLHMHLVVAAGDKCAKELLLGQRLWKSLRKAGDYYCERLESRERYARYITKELRSPERFDSVFVYNPPNT